jgi:heme/copper-type cytochrome/quinol oxidase subunit 2
MFAYVIFSNDFLRFFAEDRGIRMWDEAVTSWLITALVISVLCAGAMLLVKLYQKKAAGNLVGQTWSRGETVLLMLLGLIPVFILQLIAWYTSSNFYNVMRLPGLFKGVVFAWLLYLIFMVVGHLVTPWRRELV